MPGRAAVVVGAGLAGANGAVAARDSGFDGDIILVGEEPDPPYNRPPLSKGYLRGEEDFESIRNRTEADYSGIEMLLSTRAVSIDVAARTVALDSGRSLRFDTLLLATGGINRRPPIPGIDLDGVHQLRTRRESDALRAAAASARRIAVVGLGFIGTEVAASLRMLGGEVVGIGPDALPLARIAGDEFGRALLALHQQNGVELLLGETVAAFEGQGRLERVRCASGRLVDCDLAVVGLGIEPAVELARQAGIATGPGGIIVDARGRTSIPNVFAAGDNTVREHPRFGRLHIEHWNNADQAGTSAGRNLAGREELMNEIPSFWSDQFDVHIEYVGNQPRAERTVVRGDLDSWRFMCFYLVESRVRAVSAMGYGDDIVPALEQLIREGRVVDPERLAADGSDLERLVY